MNTRDQLIRKLFAKQCTRLELEILFEILKESQEESGPEVMMELLEQLEQVPELEPAVSDEILRKVRKATRTNKEAEASKLRPTHLRTLRIWASVAAAVGALVTTWLVLQWLFPREVVVHCPFGQMQEVVLPDNSVVVLNGNSTIGYLPEWNDGQLRKVKLKGEAFFKVEKKPTKFQVVTDDLTVEVLGTAFNVNTRQETSEVFLEEGSVKLSLRNEASMEVLLEPGEVASYSLKKRVFVKPKKVDEALEISWKEGFLIFKDTPLEKILDELFANNDFEFEIKARSLAEKRFTLSLPNNDIHAAMELLNRTVAAHISKLENKFIISTKE